MKKIIISGMIGNALEWYDFALYGHLAVIISKLFFPSEDHFTSFIAALSVFAAGFIMRPLGGIFFGYIGDKFGRKTSLVLSILLMAIPTACIGILPTYEQIGVLAPLSLLLIRLLQGLSLGGGFSGCIAFIIEHAPSNKRALAGSASLVSMCAGILFGLGICTLLSHMMSEHDFQVWGWRIPFLISLLIGLVAFYIRNHVHESPVYLKAKEQGTISKTPIKDVFSQYRLELLVAIGLYVSVTVPFYTLTIFMNNYMTSVLGHTLREAATINSISIIAHMAIVPFASMLSDKYGRKPILLASCIAYILLTYPVFLLLTQPGFILPLIGQIIFASILAFYIAPIPAVLVELFPTSVRFTGISLSYNISAAAFGGTTPAMAMWLIKSTGLNISLAFYIILFAILSLITLFYYRDSFQEVLA
jgi:MHS family proline/betaine transporter-like MFS transporter